MTLEEAQQLQRDFDARHWQVGSAGLEKLRHIALHLAISVGKISRHCERLEHNGPSPISMHEVAADLLAHALQLANLSEFDLAHI